MRAQDFAIFAVTTAIVVAIIFRVPQIRQIIVG